MRFPELLRRAFRNGSPRLWHVLPYLAYWLMPKWLLRQLRALLRVRRIGVPLSDEDMTFGISRK